MNPVQVDDYRWRLPRSAGMTVEGMIYASEPLIRKMQSDKTIEQVANVARLPGLVGASLAMPDAHQGYGFCIGGVAASDPDRGIVSAGGVGFDINCGVRLLATGMQIDEISSAVPGIMKELFRDIPCGAGRRGTSVGAAELDRVLGEGARWAVGAGHGERADLERIEEGGSIGGADPDAVSPRAKERGKSQLGTLGSGNHFLEFQHVSEIFDETTAAAFGISAGEAVILIHSGSRGLGHQVCTDYLEEMNDAMPRYGISVPDRQLACAPVGSKEGRRYLAAMAAAANFAFANRQLMTEAVRRAFARRRGTVRVVYDVCHNIAKFEEHVVDGKKRRVLVHRKGATRAFPKGHPALGPDLRESGQPVLIPGSMGTASYVLVGTGEAMRETFGSSCHGAGRAKSRTQARRETAPADLLLELKSKGILVLSQSGAGLTEEKPDAYKDVDEVVDVVHNAGIARRVAKLKPVAVMKG